MSHVNGSSALMAYRDAWHQVEDAKKALVQAQEALVTAQRDKQRTWDVVNQLRSTNTIKEGIYRVGRSQHDEGLAIAYGTTLPDVFDMFNAYKE